MIDFAQADAVMRAACGKQFTAAVGRVEYRGVPVFERAYGQTRADGRGLPVYVDTHFDLASLTKIVIATVLLKLVARGELDLDASLVQWFPKWRGSAHAQITLRMLLAHTSGMNSGADYRSLLSDEIEAFALTRSLVGIPGANVVYSDLGFIVLGVLLACVTGRSLENVLAKTIGRPTLHYRPRAGERRAIPATEDDGWRGRVQGRVHDEKAYLMGGTAGHAGLFGTAADVTHVTQMYLGPLCGRPESLLPSDIARAAVTQAADDPVLRRGLGWALKTSDQNSCGRRFAPSSFGHSGFVGTCVWADPKRDVAAVLLTNSVYFGRRDTSALRAAFYDAIVFDIESAPC